MAIQTAEEQLKKLKEKEKAIKAKIRKEKEKKELQELKKLQKDFQYFKYIDIEALKQFVDKHINKIVEVSNFRDDNKISMKLDDEKIKTILANRIKSKISYFEIEKLQK